ncbi:putative terminase large subunit [uncultured Mycobacterium sp.]|uniref:Putative terminase large subunit n=1 Tax=uncultured Mycobacterium sp. TaxID=171292 RepID=A0A1Y5P527_9MYCO|nr:putative terminase large subunit [uncultured Mycobacterium sp.]
MTTTELPPGKTNRPWLKRWPEWLGKFPRLTGRQQPEHETWHEGDESEGDRATRFGARIGVWLLPWEWMIVRAVLSLLPVNEFGIRLYTHRVVVLECTRQQGKTLLLILIILWKLFKRRRRIVYTAQQWATVEDVFDRVCAIIDRVPSLKNRLAKPPSKKDNRGTIVLKPIRGDKHLVQAQFGPRTQHFARGFTELDDVIFDEAYDLVPKEVANLTGAQAASDNAQTFYVSTPPVVSQHPNCHRFSGLVRTVENGGAPGLYGALFRAPKSSFKRGDPAAYPLAQPSYGVVGNDRDMEAHLQGAKDAGPEDLALFDADWLGWGDYPPPSNKRPSEIPADEWKAMRNPSPKLVGRPAIGVHCDPDSGIWAIVGAQRTDSGLVHIEFRPPLGKLGPTTSHEAVRAVVDLVTAMNPVAVAIKRRGDAASIEDDLIQAGIEPEMVDGGRWSQWCGGFLNAALDSRLSHSGQSVLEDAAGSAVRKDMTAGGFVWDEDAAGVSAPALFASTLAHGALIAKSEPPKRKTVPPRTAAPRRRARELFNPMTASM